VACHAYALDHSTGLRCHVRIVIEFRTGPVTRPTLSSREAHATLRPGSACVASRPPSTPRRKTRPA
jgi:hypothetical protein